MTVVVPMNESGSGGNNDSGGPGDDGGDSDGDGDAGAKKTDSG